MTKLLKPPKNRIWIHVDKLGTKKPWAIQYWKNDKHYYMTAEAIIISYISIYTVRNKTQPRLVLETTSTNLQYIFPKGAKL